MKEKILKNLFLRVDYEKRKTQSGIALPGVAFFLIGTLPILIRYANGKKEVAALNSRETIEGRDPKLRNIMGAKAIDEERAKKYKSQIDSICGKLEKIVDKALSEGRWQGVPIKEIALIKS